MVAWIGLAGLLATLIVQIRVDARLWEASATPGVLLSGGFTLVAAIYAVASLVYRFNPIHIATYVFLILASLVLVMISLVARSLLPPKSLVRTIRIRKTGKWLRLSLLVVALAYGYVAFSIASSAGGLWSSESMPYLSSGPLGHASILLAFLLIWYAEATEDGKLWRYPLFGLALVAISFNPVKGWTVIPLIAIVLSEMSRGQTGKSRIMPMLVGAAIGVLVFVAIYGARSINSEADNELVLVALQEIAAHFVFYATSGFFGLDAVLQGLELNGGLEILFAPFANIVSLLSNDEYVKIISNIYIIGIQDGGNGGNVFSMYGSLIGYAGLFLGSVLAVLIVFCSYLFRAYAATSGSNVWTAVSNYFCAILAFGWFEYYFWHLTPFEIILFAAMVSLAAACLRGKRDVSQGAGYQV